MLSITRGLMEVGLAKCIHCPVSPQLWLKRAIWTYHWSLMARSAEPRAPLLLRGLGGQVAPWALACLAPPASLVAPEVQVRQAHPRYPVVLGSQEGPGGQGVHPCLVGLGGLGPH